ncbi:MAG: sulfotransferase family protein [Magnetospiraceae bacterium]
MGQPPILILGLTHRSGTNYLADLVSAHPGCTRPSGLGEDFLLMHSHLLSSYVDRTLGSWQPEWKSGDKDKIFEAAFADALGGFLNRIADEDDKRVVVKTPSTRNIANFYRFFPDAHLLIIVRDGRATLESGMRSFGWSFEQGLVNWTRNATLINRFLAQGGDRHKLVRYEDLFTDNQKVLTEIFEFLGLPVADYAFDGAANLAVRGSSELTQSDTSDLHWTPVKKSKDFDPLSRAAHWTDAQKKRFDWVAGDAARQLGYAVEASIGPSDRWKNTLMDAKRALGWRLRRLAK